MQTKDGVSPTPLSRVHEQVYTCKILYYGRRKHCSAVPHLIDVIHASLCESVRAKLMATSPVSHSSASAKLAGVDFVGMTRMWSSLDAIFASNQTLERAVLIAAENQYRSIMSY